MTAIATTVARAASWASPLPDLPVAFDISTQDADIRRELPVWFALGLPKGIRFSPREGDPANGYVSHGGILEKLSSDEYRSWFRLIVPRSRSNLVTIGLDEASPMLAALERRDLVVRISDLKNARQVFSRVRVIPQGYVLGNMPSDPKGCFMLLPDGKSRARVSTIDWAIWSLFDASSTLVSVCDRVAADLGTDGQTVFSRGLATVTLMSWAGLVLLDLDPAQRVPGG